MLYIGEINTVQEMIFYKHLDKLPFLEVIGRRTALS